VAEYTSRCELPWKMDKIQVFATREMLCLLMNNRNEHKSEFSQHGGGDGGVV
jgi:hypothetical protein